jgi:hypothetical protein
MDVSGIFFAQPLCNAWDMINHSLLAQANEGRFCPAWIIEPGLFFFNKYTSTDNKNS